jgi:hypothetical protein
VETCDAVDNNCNGSADENVTRLVRSGWDQVEPPGPVDIILVVTNTATMMDEIQALERTLDNSFAQVLAQGGVDYRIILLSGHGSSATDQSICVQSPLSGNGNCTSPAACPLNGPRFFHYSTAVRAHDSLSVILTTYNAPDPCGEAPQGWSQWLRPGAARVFIEVTDSEPLAWWPTPPSTASPPTASSSASSTSRPRSSAPRPSATTSSTSSEA